MCSQSNKKELKIMWNEMIDFGFNVNNMGIGMGLTKWREVKDKIIAYDHDSQFPLSKCFCQLADSKIVYEAHEKEDEDATVKFNSIEIVLNNKTTEQHFLVQHFRIPKTSDYLLSLTKLLQIAYNVGQLKAVIKRKDHQLYLDNPAIMEKYNKYKLYKLSTFIDMSSIDNYVKGKKLCAENISEILEESLRSRISGGAINNYYHKYLKYKTKYTNLKQSQKLI